MKFKIKKWMIGSISGLFISGVLINAVWDLIKSSSGAFLVFLVRVTTLGIQKLNDDIYKTIAKGFHESSSLQLYVFFFALMLGFSLSMVLSIFLIKRRLNGKDAQGDKDGFSIKFIKSKLSTYIFIAYFVVFGTISVFDIARNVYINMAISYYEQLLSIVGPDLTDAQKDVYDSVFAQIQDKEGYVKLIDELEILAKDKGYIIPIKPSIL